MLLVYSGPHTTGVEIAVCGTFVPRNVPTEVPDEVAEALLDSNPGDWSVTTPDDPPAAEKPKKASKS